MEMFEKYGNGSFDWTEIEPGASFWDDWNHDKQAMRAAGFRVTKRADGKWLACREVESSVA